MTTERIGLETIAEFRHEGFACTVRHYISYMGYVDVPEGHPWHGLGYEDLADVDVHGGLSYSDTEGTLWRVGFDCGHADDSSDREALAQPEPHERAVFDLGNNLFPIIDTHGTRGRMWTEDAVTEEVKRLAEQAAIVSNA